MTVDDQRNPQHGAGPRHGWLMVICCVPMLVIAIVLVATGIVSLRFVGAAVMCTVMMVLMMRMMSGSGHGTHGG